MRCDLVRRCGSCQSCDVVRCDELQCHALAIDHLVHGEAGELNAGVASIGRVDCHLMMNSRRGRSVRANRQGRRGRKSGPASRPCTSSPGARAYAWSFFPVSPAYKVRHSLAIILWIRKPPHWRVERRVSQGRLEREGFGFRSSMPPSKPQLPNPCTPRVHSSQRYARTMFCSSHKHRLSHV